MGEKAMKSIEAGCDMVWLVTIMMEQWMLLILLKKRCPDVSEN